VSCSTLQAAASAGGISTQGSSTGCAAAWAAAAADTAAAAAAAAAAEPGRAPWCCGGGWGALPPLAAGVAACGGDEVVAAGRGWCISLMEATAAEPGSTCSSARHRCQCWACGLRRTRASRHAARCHDSHLDGLVRRRGCGLERQCCLLNQPCTQAKGQQVDRCGCQHRPAAAVDQAQLHAGVDDAVHDVWALAVPEPGHQVGCQHKAGVARQRRRRHGRWRGAVVQLKVHRGRGARILQRLSAGQVWRGEHAQLQAEAGHTGDQQHVLAEVLGRRRRSSCRLLARLGRHLAGVLCGCGCFLSVVIALRRKSGVLIDVLLGKQCLDVNLCPICAFHTTSLRFCISCSAVKLQHCAVKRQSVAFLAGRCTFFSSCQATTQQQLAPCSAISTCRSAYHRCVRAEWWRAGNSSSMHVPVRL
jgi:hypothetical protein